MNLELDDNEQILDLMENLMKVKGKIVSKGGEKIDQEREKNK